MDDLDSLHDLHNRFLLQARWSAENRHRLFQMMHLDRASNILEVGCGTGAITHELSTIGSITTYGIDIDPDMVHFAHSIDVDTRYIVGDGFHIPFPSNAFNATICHFLLMWVSDPVAILKEMRRVTRPGGAILALAEPDYGGRIDYPKALESLGQRQADALEAQGADPQAGRKLMDYFIRSGIDDLHVGVLGGEWHGIPDEVTLASEWNMLSKDLCGIVSQETLSSFQEMNWNAWREGHRILYVPTFYAAGRTPMHYAFHGEETPP
jgi:ubiquinone/menaquinone biosynthesis C-methylase UbiE